MNRAQVVLARFDDAEYRVCRGLNRAAAQPWVRATMQVASRLGDGLLWYVMLAVLPLLFGVAAIRPALVMMLTGVAGLLIYRRLKATLVRERPFIRHPGITRGMAPLDRYSFPPRACLHSGRRCVAAQNAFRQGARRDAWSFHVSAEQRRMRAF
jgi:undecaprenyl-diphosphatase